MRRRLGLILLFLLFGACTPGPEPLPEIVTMFEAGDVALYAGPVNLSAYLAGPPRTGAYLRGEVVTFWAAAEGRTLPEDLPTTTLYIVPLGIQDRFAFGGVGDEMRGSVEYAAFDGSNSRACQARWDEVPNSGGRLGIFLRCVDPDTGDVCTVVLDVVAADRCAGINARTPGFDFNGSVPLP